MRGRTNIPPRPNVIINGDLNDFVVANNSSIDIGDFVEIERTKGYQAIGDTVLNFAVHADISDTLKIIVYTNTTSTTYDFKVSLIDVSTGTAKILDTYDFVRTNARNKGGTDYAIRSTSVLVLDDGTIVCGTSAVYSGDPLVVRLSVVDSKLVEVGRFTSVGSIPGVNNGGLIKLSNSRFALVHSKRMSIFSYTSTAITFIKELQAPTYNSYCSAFGGATSDGRVILVTYNGDDETYQQHYYFELLKIDTSNNISLLGYVDTNWNKSLTDSYSYAIQYAMPLANDGVIVFSRKYIGSGSTPKTCTLMSILFDASNIYMGTTTTFGNIFRDVYPSVTSLTEEYCRMYRIANNTFVTAVQTGATYMYGIVNVDSTGFSLLTNALTFICQANVLTYPVTDMVVLFSDDYLYLIGRGYVNSNASLNQLKLKYTPSDSYIEIGEDTVYVRKYTGGKAIGFAKTGGNAGQIVKIYTPVTE